MGCKTYVYNNIPIKFNEGDDNTSCLCTFPHNYESSKVIDKDVVRSFALLGAAIAMIHNKSVKIESGNYFQLPNDLPEWVIDEISEITK